MLDDFVSKYPNVTYELYRSGTGDVKTKLSTELDAGGTDACIVWFADLGYMYDLDDEGLILHYEPDSIADVPDEYKYNDGMGHEVRAIYSVLAYNTTQITEAPTDWDDVLTSDYTGSFALASPAYSGGALTTLSVHVEPDNEDLVGWDWYQALADNDVKMEQSNGTLLTKVASGEYKGAAIVDYLPRNAKAEGSPIDYVYPESGSVLIPTPLCLMSTMPEEDAEAAKAFVDYMFELDTQKLFVSQGYVPIISEAAEGTDVPTIDDIKVLPMDVEYMRENTSALLEKFTDIFGEQ
jgi:iron(III) transport system substrate-binding protein